MARICHSGRLATAVFAVVLCLGFLSNAALAIQVTPNSPCASLCIDSAGLDTSDPNSSNTVNADIVCNDADFASKSAGKKWTACMGCLQNSTFSQGAESDQAWFFYNLRYNVDYCIFGYPDAGDAIGSSPCQTSTACGPLQGSLYDGVPRMGNRTEFAYCTANGTTLSSSQFKGCTACVGGSGDQNIVANSLIALEAGCLQQLPPDEAVGLSGSVFASATTISIVAPTQTSGSGSDASGSGAGNRHVATTTIAIIVVVALLAVAAIGGFAFVCYRKRRGSARRGAAGSKSIFRKNKEQDGFYGEEGGFGKAGGGGGGGSSSGFVPSGGIRGSGLGGFVSVPTGGASVRGSPASAADPNAWSSRFPSSEVITSPLSFQCRASATSLGDMVDLKAVAESSPPAATVASNRGGGHSRSSSTGSIEMAVALQEQQLQQQVQTASRRKHQKPQAISSAAIHAAINAAAASNSTATTISATNSIGSGGSSGHLSAIVESPFPSPAPVAHNGNGVDGIGNIGMRIHSIDFDKKGYTEAAAAVSQSPPPRLHQLKTSFSPYLGTTSSPSYNTPTSSTALLSSTSLTGQLPSPPTGHSVYNPSVYAPSHGAAGPSPTAYTTMAAAAGKRGVYQGWSAMVSAAQQYQQQQLQQQHLQMAHGPNSATASMPASAVGSYRGEREPASAVSVVSVVSLASSNGLGAATMAARQTFSDREPQSANGAGDVSATSMNPPGGGFPPASSAASSTRQHTKSPHARSPHAKAKLPLGSSKPSHARSPHTQTELVQTEFLPPPPARTRR